MRPPSITYARLGEPSATCTNCSIRSTPTPSAAAASSAGISRCTTTGASPSDSSSTSMNFGRETSACASTTICCSPPESVRAVALPPRLRGAGRARARARSLPSRPRARARRSRRACCPRPSARAGAAGPRGRSRRPPAGSAPGRSLVRLRAVDASRRLRSVRRTPPTASTIVDLPAPFGPSSVVTAPGGISSETPCSTAWPPRATRQLVDLQRARAHAHVIVAVLRPEVRAHHVLVAQDLRRRAGRDQLAEVDTAVVSQHAETRLMSWSTRITSAPNVRGDLLDHLRRGGRSPRRAGRRRARRAARRAACRRRRARSRRAGARARRARRPSPSATTSSPTNSIAAEHVVAPRRALRARVLVDHRDVVEDRELLDRHLGLERPPQSPARAAVVGHLQQVLAEGGDRAGGRLDEAAESTLKNVVLPAPFGPIRPQVPPGNATLMSSIGVTPAKRTVSP